MLSVLRVHLPSDIPIVGCELSPYVQLRCPDSSVTVEDVPESAPLDGFYLRCRWYRIHSDKRIAVCSVHPSELATLQCLGCLKTKLPVSKSYHCSAKCFSDSWRYHRSLHARAASAVKEASAEEEELFSRFNSTGPAVIGQGGSGINLGSVSSGNVNNGPPYVSIRTSDQSGGEKWYEVGQGKVYTPSAEDIGYILKLECVIVSLTSGMAVGGPTTLLTGRVIPAPSPTPRRMVSVNSADGNPVELEGRVPAPGTFTVMSYNVLAHLYATSEMYSYCPSWALSWTYRRQNLLREIVGYRADIICLQEVQSDHFEEYFSPELEKHGYAAVYKRKTTEVYTGSAYAIDGCATFFKRDRFLLVKKYEVEFNKAAQSMSEAVVHPSQRKTALTRLLKDNVALIVVLESQDSIHGMELPSATNRRQLICVANTHINANPELKDVKLWQVHTLLKGLEKIAASADIPMLVVGDFNSLPGSAPHSLLATGSVDPGHPELDTDPLGILHPPSKLCHQLPLRSAYSAFSRMTGTASNCERQRQRIDSTTSEPLFTNCTRDFLGTLDYIFYTGDSLVVESLLELLDEESLRKDTALPSPEWSSDHIALLAEFRCRSRPRR